MKSLLSLLQHRYWRLRLALGLDCANADELEYRIHRLVTRPTPGRHFNFPWGKIEFVNASDLRGQYFEIFAQRHYAFKTAHPKPVIIDGGGNIGMSAIWFKREYPQADLTVYEADPDLAAVLQRNLQSAGIVGVNVHNAAVWTQDGTVAFDNQGKDMGAVRTGGGIQVKSVDLAASLPERVDLLKLDVEGAEYAIVERLCATGKIARVMNFVAEYHVPMDTFDAFLESLRQLRQAGFQVTMTSVLGPWLGQMPAPSAFELVGHDQLLVEVYAWRPTSTVPGKN